MISWFARNHVAANLLLFAIVVTGVFTLVNKLPIEVLPSFELEEISISTTYQGTTPKEIEESITLKIEEEIADITGIKKITSRSSENISSVSLEIEDGYNVDDILVDVKSSVDSINDFPSDADNPIVKKVEILREVITVAIYGQSSERDLRDYSESLRNRLLLNPKISQAQLESVRDFEMIIEVSQDRLQEFDLTLDDVAEAVNQSSLNLSAGNVKSLAGDVLVRLQGQAYDKAAFENIFIKGSESGQSIYLRDIATVEDGFEESDLKVVFNGRPAAWVEVYRVGKESAIEVANEVKSFVQEEQANLPPNVNVGIWNDRSRLIKSRLSTLAKSALQGGILVVLMLSLFLRPSVALWVSLGIPISFLGGVIVMPWIGLSINMISVFAFIMVLGIVVDDAIVTGENVYRHIRNGKKGLDAAIYGTKEVSVPVTFGVLTTIAAFIPMLMLEGFRGKMFYQIPAVVIPVLLFSLVESKLILPAHLKKVKARDENKKQNFLMNFQMRFSHGFEANIIKYYKPMLAKCLRNKATVLAALFAVAMIVYGMTMFGWLKFVFFPRIESEQIRATLVMPSSTPFETTDVYVDRMLNTALELQDKYRDEQSGISIIQNISAETGSAGRSSGSNMGRVRIEMQEPDKRAFEKSVKDVVTEWRDLIGVIPGLESLSFRAEIGRGGDPIDVQLAGENFEKMEQVAEKTKMFLAQYDGVFDIIDSYSDGKVEMSVELKPGAENLGVNKTLLARQLRNTFFGIVVQSFQRGREDIDVRVRFPLSERQSLQNVENLYVKTSSGSTVLFNEIAELKPSLSPVSIYRIDRQRTLNVTADIEKNNVQIEQLKEDLSAFVNSQLSPNDGIDFSLEGEAKEQRETFGSLFWNTGLLLFVIYILLAIPFKSYLQPFIVMSIIPFGVMGAIIGHMIIGFDLSLMSILGTVALLGVVVNDSLVMVDFINQQRRNGIDVFTAVNEAGVMRFRPVILTSLTTFVGLVPLLLEKSTQAQFLKPMAVSLGFGILFATVITLFIVPVNYLLAYQAKRGLVKMVNKVAGKKATVADAKS